MLMAPLPGRPCAFCACWPAAAPAIISPLQERHTWGKTRSRCKECLPPRLGLGRNRRVNSEPIIIVNHCVLKIITNLAQHRTLGTAYRAPRHVCTILILACIRSLSYTSACTDSAFTLVAERFERSLLHSQWRWSPLGNQG